MVIILTIFLVKKSNHVRKKDVDVVEVKEKTKIDKTEEINYKVDLKGEVNNPGIYTLKKGSRVIDVIEAGGGLTENANTEVINLSKKISDEMVIIIYSNYEVREFAKTKEVEEKVQNKCVQKDDVSLKNDACITSNNTNKVQGKININIASKDELMTLTGIGESKANDIIKYREEHKFNTIEDIKEVSGIGDSLFAKIKENITV